MIAERPQESTHWYAKDGSPAYTVTAKNGEPRPTTLRDAKKLGLLPSVTTIMKAAASPGLEAWKMNQMMLAALTLPRGEGENEESFIKRIQADSREHAKMAAERGTAVHAAIERFYEGTIEDITDRVRDRVALQQNTEQLRLLAAQVPGMVYASTVHAPVQLATPLRWNDAEIRAMKGVSDIVKLDRGVAVVADTFEHAIAARDGLQVEWRPDSAAQGYDSEQALFETYPAMAQEPGQGSPVNRTGDANAAFAAAAKVFRAEYRRALPLPMAVLT